MSVNETISQIEKTKDVKLYNTLTRTIEKFEPIGDPKVKMYTCGPTVYNFAHIGNLRTYIFEDTLKRVLKASGYDVFHVMNITDVGHLTSDEDTGEDRMELGAKRENKTAFEIADFYFNAFANDLKRLNIEEPDIWCKATDNIKEQIDFIKILEDKGYTYIISDGVYFDTSKVDDYGKLSKLDVKGLRAGARIDITDGKKNITDFALWKFSPKDKKRQMEWDSPWGIGFPGWHVECSTMATKYLGEHIDIHCGGIDHIPVHHNNEIAQSETALGHKWVNFWLHGEFLVLDKEEKMSKSKDNFTTLETLIEKGYDPLVYRYYCLNTNYGKALVFSWKAIDSASIALNKLKSKVIEYKKASLEDEILNLKYLEDFYKTCQNDLNISLGVGIMWDMINDNSISNANKYLILLEMDKILGLKFDTMKEEEQVFDDEIMKLVKERQEARKNKDFKTSDRIRNELLKMGIALEDSKDGVRIKRI